MASSQSSIQDYIQKFNDLEVVLNSMPSGVFAILDTDLNIGTLNREAERILTVSHDKAIGRNFNEVFAARFPGLRDVLDETIKYKRPIRNYTFEIEKEDAALQTYLVSTALLTGPDVNDSGVVLVMHDITEVTRLRRNFLASRQFGPLIGQSEAIRNIFTLMDTVAQYDTSVLISGETGTGKELAARAIHERSPRSKGPFIPVACSALTPTLLESELFGHEKGAFTGAIKNRIGRFELASEGVIFLDEIGTMSMDLQVKLLRVLQERTIERVGSSDTKHVDVRIISATNRNLHTLIEQGNFREDLYYRLKVIQVDMPPLRDRKMDIPLLSDYFIERFNAVYNRGIMGLSSHTKELLLQYTWPGNVRELENAIEHALVLTPGKIIEHHYLPPEIRYMKPNGRPPLPTGIDLNKEEETLRRTLESLDYNVSKTAKTLGMHRTTLWRKMKEFHLNRDT